MNTFKLTVATPNGNLFSGEVIKLDVRSTEGELAIMAGHIQFITSLVKGPCVIHLKDGAKKTATANSGLLTVGTDFAFLLSGSFKFD